MHVIVLLVITAFIFLLYDQLQELHCSVLLCLYSCLSTTICTSTSTQFSKAIILPRDTVIKLDNILNINHLSLVLRLLLQSSTWTYSGKSLVQTWVIRTSRGTMFIYLANVTPLQIQHAHIRECSWELKCFDKWNNIVNLSFTYRLSKRFLAVYRIYHSWYALIPEQCHGNAVIQVRFNWSVLEEGMALVSAAVLLLFLVSCSARDFSFTFKLGAGKSECFYDYIHEGAFLEVEFQVSRCEWWGEIVIA